MLPTKNTFVTPIDELPLAVRACISWQAEQLLKINKNFVDTLKAGNPTSYINTRQGLGSIFTDFLLNPTANKPFLGNVLSESLKSSQQNTLIWTLKFSSSGQAAAANDALSLYFSDWPPAFGKAPDISQKSQQVKLSF